MNTSYSKQRSIAYMWMILLLITLGSCTTADHCLVGNEITIPDTDNSEPTIVGIDFHMPDGSLVTRNPGDGLSKQITVPTNGDVTVIAAVKDDQGVKDAQLFVTPITCTIDPTSELSACERSLDSAEPTVSNPETHTVGEVGCTQRLITYKVNISKSSTASQSVDISAKGINFGGQEVKFEIYTLSR